MEATLLALMPEEEVAALKDALVRAKNEYYGQHWPPSPQDLADMDDAYIDPQTFDEDDDTDWLHGP
jgi:hypothetical protein